MATTMSAASLRAPVAVAPQLRNVSRRSVRARREPVAVVAQANDTSRWVPGANEGFIRLVVIPGESLFPVAHA